MSKYHSLCASREEDKDGVYWMIEIVDARGVEHGHYSAIVYDTGKLDIVAGAGPSLTTDEPDGQLLMQCARNFYENCLEQEWPANGKTS